MLSLLGLLFYDKALFKLIEPSQQFLSKYEELLGKKAFMTFSHFLEQVLLQG